MKAPVAPTATVPPLNTPPDSRLNVPPDYTMTIGPRTKTAIPNFDSIQVVVSTEGKSSRPMEFLISSDNNTLAQFTRFDMSQDPKRLVSAAGRPARGGPVEQVHRHGARGQRLFPFGHLVTRDRR